MTAGYGFAYFRWTQLNGYSASRDCRERNCYLCAWLRNEFDRMQECMR